MTLPSLIQGGMGIAISTWKLAKAVSEAGHLGVVSGTAIGTVMVARLMRGDAEGHTRRALSHFPYQDAAQRILDKYYVPEGIPAGTPYKRPTMWTAKPPQALNELTIIANFVEVFLAKEGHSNSVGINLLEKIQTPNISSLYGAMLAGVDFVIIGAGIPMQIPGILDKLADHQAVSYHLDVFGADKDDDNRIHLVPEDIFPGVAADLGPLKRPNFLPIISSVVLAKALLKRASGRIDGFVVEGPTAGGHNAPPRGVLRLDDQGEPIYGDKDVVNLDKMKQLGLPFWLAGGHGSPEGFQKALDAGATGIQVGTAFAYCNESGMDEKSKKALIQKALSGDIVVRTSPIASPTGFPFKVVELEGSLSDMDVFEARERICEIGFLRQSYKKADGKLGYRCSAEPVDQYMKKGGTREDTVNRTCLCNNLMASAGFPQNRKSGYIEPPIITSGDILVHLAKFLKPGETSYSARDVIDYLTEGIAVQLSFAS